MAKSILQERKVCWVGGGMCGCTVEEHHVFGGVANRPKSEKYGLKIWLCKKHHTGSNKAIHKDASFSLKVKQYAQREFEKRYSRELFMKEFGRNWLDTDEDNEIDD